MKHLNVSIGSFVNKKFLTSYCNGISKSNVKSLLIPKLRHSTLFICFMWRNTDAGFSVPAIQAVFSMTQRCYPTVN